MESLVGYGSDEESGENYQDIRQMDSRDRIRQGEEDCNYDNVQMDMSEESNNNNSGSSNEDYKSPTRSSISRSSTPSSRDSVSSDEKREMKSASPMRSKVTGGRTEGVKSENGSSRHKEQQDIRGKNERSKREGSRQYEDKDHLHHDIRERDRPRQSRDRSRERERLRRDERRSKSRSRERERERRRSRSRDRSKRSRSPPDRHLRRGDKSSRFKRSPRSHERDRERRSPPVLGSSSRHRSHSRDRDRERERDRDRGKSSGSSSGSSRRGGYEKKPSKLTILERLGIELRPPEAPPAVTPQQLLQKSIEQQVQQVKSNTGIELPKYYNPAAMNPARYAEQMQKRKLLWGNKSQEGKAESQSTTQPSNNKWEGTTFAQDQDGKMTAKFKRLMGIKDTGQGASATTASTSNQEGNEILKKQEELFNSMEMQYEVARVATHTHRGVGLGFGTFQYPR